MWYLTCSYAHLVGNLSLSSWHSNLCERRTMSVLLTSVFSVSGIEGSSKRVVVEWIEWPPRSLPNSCQIEVKQCIAWNKRACRKAEMYIWWIFPKWTYSYLSKNLLPPKWNPYPESSQNGLVLFLFEININKNIWLNLCLSGFFLFKNVRVFLKIPDCI